MNRRSTDYAGLRRVVRGLLCYLLCLSCILATRAQVPGGESDSVEIRIGFTQGIFKNQNETDILAAMKVWASTLSVQHDIRIDTRMRVYHSQSEAEAALRENRVDAVIVLFDEFTEFPPGLVSGPFFRNEIDGRIEEEFLVLAHKDRGIRTLKDLHGGKLAIHDYKYAGLASAWLDAQLAKSGLAAAGELLDSVTQSNKLSAVVIGVYFGKHDAGLVSRKGFLSMGELNPQVAKQLHIVAQAPPIIPTVFCFRKGLGDDRKKELFQEVMRLHESVTGEQVLRVFKSDRMTGVTIEQVERSRALLADWKAARAEPPEPLPQETESRR